MVDRLVLVPDAMASDGRAIARDGAGKVHFIEGALPGETVAVEVDLDRPRYADSVAVDIRQPSPDRVDPPCPRLAEGCGGCQWQHVDPAAQRRLKAGMIIDALRRIGRLDRPPLRPTVELDPWHYRTALRVGIIDGRAALRRRHAHDLVHASGCLIVHPRLAELLEGRRYAGANEVILRCGARTGERLAVTVPRGVKPDLPGDVGTRHYHEKAAGRLWRISARSFFQSRPDGADALAALVLDGASELGPPDRAVDLYSGVGLFAGALAETGWKATAVEGVRTAVDDARTNLSGLAVDVIRADVAGWAAVPAALVVADPSRSGLAAAGVGAVARTGARRVILISCDAASLGRDAGLLTGAGYGLVSVTPVDLFPQTSHIEAVSVFDRL
jgi:23S rRNA (uracil1939-C5)-methyltransferase